MDFSAAIGVLLLTLLTATRANAADENPLALHYIASEFYSVCVQSEAQPDRIAAAAKLRGWRKRPTEWSQFFGDHVDEAWDGDLSSIELLTGASLPKARFVVTRKTERGSPLCTFIFQGATEEALDSILETQGMRRDGLYFWRIGKFKYESTLYCLDDQTWGHADYQIEAYSGRIKGWPGGEAAYLTFRSYRRNTSETRKAAGGDAVCPIRYFTDGPSFSSAARTPPLTKVEEPPPTAPATDGADAAPSSLGEGADPH
ncbi:MAG: hypothetical protein R3C60_05155 [Parvularculaceae bacterium]